MRNELITTEITDKKTAVYWIKGMAESGLAFHFEDEPEDIGIFQPEEIEPIKERISEVFKYLPDPFIWLLRFTNR